MVLIIVQIQRALWYPLWPFLWIVSMVTRRSIFELTVSYYLFFKPKMINIVLAQSAVETFKDGKPFNSNLAKYSNNYFGLSVGPRFLFKSGVIPVTDAYGNVSQTEPMMNAYWNLSNCVASYVYYVQVYLKPKDVTLDSWVESLVALNYFTADPVDYARNLQYHLGKPYTKSAWYGVLLALLMAVGTSVFLLVPLLKKIKAYIIRFKNSKVKTWVST